MDCVGCEKCKLWEKLQVQGLGTALKILFSGSFDPVHNPQTFGLKYMKRNRFQLTRIENFQCIWNTIKQQIPFGEFPSPSRKEMVGIEKIDN